MNRMPVLAALLALAAGAAPAGAQEPALDAGMYRMFQSGAELGRESFRRTAAAFESSMELPILGARLTYRTAFDSGGRVARFAMRVVNLSTDSLQLAYEAVAAGDSLRLWQDRPGQTPSERRWTRAATPDAVVAPQSAAGLLRLVERAQRRDTSFRVWSVGSDSVLAVPVTFAGDTARLAFGPIEMRALLGPAGQVESADIPLQRVHIERWAGGDSLPPLPGAHRPAADYAAPPGAPYTAEQVRVPVRPATGDTFSLAGTLTVPKSGRAPYPAAVMITGSGLQDRDENLWPLVQGYRPFRQIAERLAAAGIAVLRVDDRGFGGSTGNPADATTADFANDVAAEVAWLRQRPDVDPARIALIGHSEGGIIAPMLAARDHRLAAIVMMAGSAKPGVQVLLDQAVGPIAREADLSAARRSQLEAATAQAVESDTAPASPWLRWFRTYDPLPTARRVRQPVLILQGALDRQVSAGQADTLAAAMRAAGNRNVTERVFPRLNHLFLVSPTDGSPSEYPALKDTAIPGAVLDTLADWLAARLHAGR